MYQIYAPSTSVGLLPRMAAVTVSTGPVEAKGEKVYGHRVFKVYIAMSGYMQDMHVHVLRAQSFLKTGMWMRIPSAIFTTNPPLSVSTLTTGNAEVA